MPAHGDQQHGDQAKHAPQLSVLSEVAPKKGSRRSTEDTQKPQTPQRPIAAATSFKPLLLGYGTVQTSNSELDAAEQRVRVRAC